MGKVVVLIATNGEKESVKVFATMEAADAYADNIPEGWNALYSWYEVHG